MDSVRDQLKWKQVFVLKDRGTVCGTIAFANYGSEMEPKYSLSNVFVDVDRHGEGLGTRLVAFIIDIARGQGAGDLHVPSTRNAVAFYEKFGFVVGESQPDVDDEITWMTKEL